MHITERDIAMDEYALEKRSGRRFLPAFLVAAMIASAGFAADKPFTLSDLIAPRGLPYKNPVTTISVNVGDVAHLSPWRLKRRFPRSSGDRGGQLVSLRDALLAINELVAHDDEMPEHTFTFADDGALMSICDITVCRSADGGSPSEIRVSVDGGAPTCVTTELLGRPIRDFAKVDFIGDAKGGKSGDHHAAPSPAASSGKDSGAMDDSPHKTGDVKVMTLPGGAKIEMIWCGPGSFMMGSPKNEAGRFDDEPIHPVTLTKGFWLGKYEITQEQWESVMGENHSKFKGPKRPVENISWDDCHKFVDRVNVTFGGRARMPTEAEWEYACRAGSGAPVSGNGHLIDMAWFDRNSGSQTHPVGENQANAWGFYDMHGNVLEWCLDWFSLPEGQAVDPRGPSTGVFKVLRGGCWFFYERDCRSAYRLKRDPSIRNCIFGFRLACSGSEGK